MSRRSGKTVVVCPAPPDKCELCGKIEELRPYGPGGERICCDCALKNPEATERQMMRVLLVRTPSENPGS